MRLFKTEIRILQELAEDGFVVDQGNAGMRYDAALRRLLNANVIRESGMIEAKDEPDLTVYVFGTECW
jgi:hypothetical protein